jgi:diguanylate cyclase (GGDEF)-like protein
MPLYAGAPEAHSTPTTDSDNVMGNVEDPGEREGSPCALLDRLGVRGASARAELTEMIASAEPLAVWACTGARTTLLLRTHPDAGDREVAGDWQPVDWNDVVHAADRDRVSAAWRRFVESERRSWTARYRVLGSGSGEERIVEDRGVRLEQGADIEFVGMSEDITDRSATASAVRHLASQQAAFQRVSAFVAAGPGAADVAALVAREAAELCETEAGGVVRFGEADSAVLTGWWSRSPSPMAIGDAIDISVPNAVGGVHRTGRSARVGWAPQAVDAGFDIAERVAVPINVAGRVWGAVAIASAARITSDAEAHLQRFAELVALAISEVEAREALQARIRQQAAVNELSVLALGRGDIDDLLAGAVGHVSTILGVDAAYVVEGLGDGRAVARAATSAARAHVGIDFDATPDTMTGIALAGGVSLVVEDFAADRRFGPVSATVTATGMVGGAYFVIRLPDRVWGLICVLTAARREFAADDLVFLESVSNVIGSAIEMSESEQTIRHQALHDALTGLPNSTLLADRLAQALDRAARTSSLVAVFYIDLDRFKDVNDSYGHSAGDALLVAVARQLETAVRPGDTAARVGGDAFAVVAEGLDGPEEALALGERFLREVRDENGAPIGASIGVAVRSSGDAAAEAMRDADTALHRAKAAGRGRVELFDNEMRVRMLDRLQTEADLRLALQRDELDLHYQPIILLADGSIAALEGLVRWQHPSRGLLVPGAFIAIAEESGLIMELGRFVIARACADAARWNALRPTAPPIAVSVNLSPHQLGDEGLAEFIATSIRASGIRPQQLGLEITETVVLGEDPTHLARLLAIKAIGLRLLLDDFGTGYSSLSHLRTVPLDTLKLDRSFVAGIDQNDRDSAIVVATRELARALSLEVVAEGVETAEQAIRLQAIGCEYVQGYFFSRPKRRPEIDVLLATEEPWRLDARREVLAVKQNPTSE